MEPLNLHEVAAAARGTLSKPQVPAYVRGVTTDSRHVAPGDLFVCLEGPRHDGHRFARQAVAHGAVAVMTHRPIPGLTCPTVEVPDTRAALGRLSRFVRARRRELLVVGVTGTNGKTSTKDLCAAALRARYRTVAAQRSFNNAVGVPLTLLALQRDTEAAVVEIGTSGPGEIGRLAALARPQVAIITNIGRAHLQGLGSVEGVRDEKAALLDALEGRRVAVLNRDDPSFEWLAERAPGPVISVGLQPGADVHATRVRCGTDGTRFEVAGRCEVRLRHVGRHAVGNALAAIAAACICGVDLEAAATALADVPAPPGRLQLRAIGDVVVVDDTYNANPGSMRAALTALEDLALPGRRIVVLGEMLELGDSSRVLHEEAGADVARARPARLVAVGSHAEHVVQGARDAGMARDAGHACATVDEAARRLEGLLRPGDVVLVKGSRGVCLDALVEHLAARRRGARPAGRVVA